MEMMWRSLVAVTRSSTSVLVCDDAVCFRGQRTLPVESLDQLYVQAAGLHPLLLLKVQVLFS